MQTSPRPAVETTPGLMSKFGSLLRRVYGERKETKRSVERAEVPVAARPGTFEAALQRMLARDITDSERRARRKNTRGLPLGYSAHEANKYRRIEGSAAARARATTDELYAAERFREDEERCDSKRGARLSKFARRVMKNAARKSPREIAAQVARNVRAAREQARAPFVLPRQSATQPTLRPTVVERRAGGAIAVTPQPA